MAEESSVGTGFGIGFGLVFGIIAASVVVSVVGCIGLVYFALPAIIGSSIDDTREEGVQAVRERIEAVAVPPSFCVLTATFEYESTPTVVLQVQNGTQHTVSRAFFHGTLKTPEGSEPLVEEDFYYAIPDGLEPGATAEWRLVPNAANTLEYAPRGLDGLALEVKPIRIEGVDGTAIAE